MRFEIISKKIQISDLNIKNIIKNVASCIPKKSKKVAKLVPLCAPIMNLCVRVYKNTERTPKSFIVGMEFFCPSTSYHVQRLFFGVKSA